MEKKVFNSDGAAYGDLTNSRAWSVSKRKGRTTSREGTATFIGFQERWLYSKCEPQSR